MGKGHVYLLKRRREGTTNYARRRAVIVARTPFVAPRVSCQNILVQITSPSLAGDRVLASAHSRELLQYGWKGSRKSMPAAYLTGLLAGFKAVKRGVKKAIPYLGVSPFVMASRATAVIKGLLDAGVEVPIDGECLPPDERIKGAHIAGYAKRLLETDKAAYSSGFSQLVRLGLKPEDYPKHFEAVRKKITGSFKAKGGK